ncbi:MAG TPA: DUF2752 domain-containing protein [Nocardioides sp.]|nr:DUF2752 domain-containing protein [Nocardioides sp.]
MHAQSDTLAQHSVLRQGVARFSATTLAAVAAAGVLATVDPNRPGHYPTCPFLWATGYYCPGCGSLRACHDLLHGDPAGALARNPLALVLLPAVVAAWVLWGLRLAGVTTWSPTRIGARWIWGLLVVVLGYWAARNVPGWTWLSPA